MLPAPAVFHFPWELHPNAVEDGASVRTFGRLTYYRPEESVAILTSQHASVQYQVSVRTGFVEPFHSILGAQYLVLGEIEKAEGESAVTVRARILNCVDGVDLAVLHRAITEQRNFLERRLMETDSQTSHTYND
ncbi:CST complex subunit TEN1 [Chanos chanos]|uniref:CST complex subunit TEN1 n=1 Tax=Chanos chanos TaxID=29144 RepID=A0A6J2VZK2_CHACN|nr:CST complex subunit TEN1 [Chanos chanos]